MPDWKKILAEQQKRKHSKDPNRKWATYAKQGWEKAEQVAEDLDCTPQQVAGALRDSIAERRVERAEFVIWDKATERLEKVVAFRKVRAGRAPAESEMREPERVGRPKKPKPAAGMTVQSRRGSCGKIESISRGKLKITWDTGRQTQTTTQAFAKGDLKILS